VAEPTLGVGLSDPVFAALIVKLREAGPVKDKAVYLALGVSLQGEKELLGL
jgi:putative transposase